MKVLLINSPIRLDAKPSCIPYGLATIASTLEQAGIEVVIYDINALRPSKPEILQTLANFFKHFDFLKALDRRSEVRFNERRPGQQTGAPDN